MAVDRAPEKEARNQARRACLVLSLLAWISSFACPAWGASRQRNSHRAHQSKRLDLRCGVASRTFAKGADFSAIEPVRAQPDIDSKDVERLIPQDMRATNDPGQVAVRIADRGVSAYVDSDRFKRSSLGKTTKSVEKRMQGDVALGGAPDDPNSTQHRLKFQVRATNARALVDYEGFFKAQLHYAAFGHSAGVEVYENLAEQTRLVYGTTFLPGDTRNVFSVRMNF